MKVLAASFDALPSSMQSRAFILFALVFLALLQYLRIIAASDPSSFFADPRRAYGRRYSLVRAQQADDFITNSWDHVARPKASSDPSICVGIATVQRNDHRYFKLLVGSLLDGLDDAERQDIALVPFIANIDPRKHEAYREPWLFNLADSIPTYENVASKDRQRLRSQESAKGHEKKALFDYSYTLQTCLNTTASYILMLEDDVLAAEGWYSRTRAAIEEMEMQPRFDKSLYLRLFYNTRLQGWNSQFWPYYLWWSIVAELSLAAVLWLLRRNISSARQFLTPRTIATMLLVCSPACIGLYFAAGRQIVTLTPTDIHEMNQFGCCSQALLFPRGKCPPLLDYFKRKKRGLRDELIEKYADENQLTRWAMTPSVFQHIGARSTKWRGAGSEDVDKNGMTSTEKIWNHHFEAFDASRL